MNIKKHIPNSLTLLNLFCGCLLVIATCNIGYLDFNDISLLYLSLISISLIADLLDGMVARWLKVASPLGLQLDSLADMVTFGVFPGFLMMNMLNDTSNSILSFLGLGITLFSALRLAKFNIDTTQTSYFKGLATPSNTIFILGIFMLKESYPDFFIENGFNILLVTTIISCYLLVASLPLFSFKIKSFELKNILPQLILLISAVVLFIIMGVNALVPIILIYILLSIIFRKTFVHA